MGKWKSAVTAIKYILSGRLEQNGAEQIELLKSCNNLLVTEAELLKTLEGQVAFQSCHFDYFNPELCFLPQKSATGAKQILIAGFYGAPNLGDELMLQVLLQNLQFYNVQITVMLCDNPEYDTAYYSNVYFVHYPKITTDFNILAQHFDAVIFGGGALLDDSAYYAKAPYQFSLGRILIGLAMRFIACQKQCILLGLSSNTDFNDSEYIQKLSFIVSHSTSFSMRDPYSKESLIRMGVPAEKCPVIHDIVCADKVFSTLAISPEKHTKLSIGIVWICLKNTSKQFSELLHRLSETLQQNSIFDYKIDLIPFYEFDYNDTTFYKNIVSGLDTKECKNITVMPYSNSITDIVKIFERQNVVLNMRYHASLISGMLGLSGINIIFDQHPNYSNKMKNICDMFPDLIEMNFSDLDISKVVDCLLEISTAEYKNHIQKQYRSKIQKKAEEELKRILCNIFTDKQH